MGGQLFLLHPPLPTLLCCSVKNRSLVWSVQVFTNCNLMARDRTRSSASSRALRRLAPYNASPGDRERSRNHSRHGSTDSTREQEQTTQEPPSWAKELLEQQKQYSTELKKIKKDLEAAKRSKQEKPTEAEPEFKFEGNKKQYKLNRNVLDKIGSAMTTSDEEERNNLLQEVEALLVERNKHICLTDKYGWDTVECYMAELLASDSGDEKRIKKAIKESKQLREEKRKTAAAMWKAKKSGLQGERSRRVVLEKYRSQFSAGKSSSNLSRDSQQVCFRCFRSGHFARECRAAVTSKASEWARNTAQPSGSQQ